MNTFYHGDCKLVMEHDINSESVDLIYLDPPFFTGKIQKGRKWKPDAMEISFEDRREYWGKQQMEMHKNAPSWINSIPRSDEFKAYLYYMWERLRMCHKVLKSTGSIYLHCDWHASHYLKMVMDGIFGTDNFQNEIIWHYDYGARSKQCFGSKHDTIFTYHKSSKWLFNTSDVLIPFQSKMTEWRYTKGGQKGKEMPKGKVMSDVWSDIKINAMSSEHTGYPTQKPLKLLERIILASSNENDVVLDPFCGCGTAIIAAQKHGRQWIGIDINKDAYNVSKDREHQLSLEQQTEYKQAQYISRDLDEVMNMDGYTFEKWVNQYYEATKPYPDAQVDGITKDMIPIQSKTTKGGVDATEIHTFNSAIRSHHALPRNIKEGFFVSQNGFTDRARKLVTIDIVDKIIHLIEPSMILPATYQKEDKSK